MKQADRTTQTKANIVQAFMDILKQKPSLQIKVADITRQANVDRGTFYRYFESKDALIEDCEEEVLNKIYLSRENILHSVTSVQEFREKPNIIAPLLTTIADNLEMMDVLLNRLGDNHFFVKFRKFLLEEGLTTINKYSTATMSEKQRELFAMSTSSAIIGLISLWSSKPDEFTQQDIENVIRIIATKGVFGIV
ncbi:MAG TPA: TetR/AcrR family transcriptional regulator [Weissella thailandensis]|uniref:TetR/AcrR family transcriptional regulator n=1 Tax=Weissella thailandensis TaxID=89061 RepID=UPI001DE09115|nr:TetR/AcrR family transcriptional regulator [Weissella thailandensis]HJG83969.1 TetR/AcrR family transcriptional regulator [Weissella thailandensis]